MGSLAGPSDGSDSPGARAGSNGAFSPASADQESQPKDPSEGRAAGRRSDCLANSIIRSMPDGVFLCLCSFIPLTNVLSLRLLCKSANDRFIRDDYGWAALLRLSGLKQYANLAVALSKVTPFPLPQRRLSFQKLLFHLMGQERIWTNRRYSYEGTLKLTGSVKIATDEPREIIRLQKLTDHIDQGGCRASSLNQLHLGGNYQHMWRICRKLYPSLLKEYPETKLYSSLQDSSVPINISPMMISCKTQGTTKDRSFVLYSLRNAAALLANKNETSTSTTAPHTESVLSATQVSIPSSCLGRYPGAGRPTTPGHLSSEVRQPMTGANKEDISTWATYVDLRQKTVESVAKHFNGPEFPPAWVVHWDTLEIETELIKYKTYGRVSIHLLNQTTDNLQPKFSSPATVFWLLLTDSVTSDVSKNPQIRSLSALGLIGHNNSQDYCSWLIAAGTNLGNIHLAMSSGDHSILSSSDNSSCPKTKIESDQSIVLTLPVEITSVKLSCDQLLVSADATSMRGSADVINFILLYALGESGHLRILSTQITTGSISDAVWECLFSIDALKPVQLLTHWSPPMRQLLVAFRAGPLVDSYCFEIAAGRLTSAYERVSIDFDQVGAADCEVQIVVPKDKRRNSDGSNGDCLASENSVQRRPFRIMRRWVARLNGVPLTDVYAAAFLGCWIIVMRNHNLKIIRIGRGKRSNRLSYQTEGQLRGHQAYIYLCAFDGFHRFASIDVSGDVFVWDIARCRRVFKFHVLDSDQGVQPPSAADDDVTGQSNSSSSNSEIQNPKNDSPLLLPMDSPEEHFPMLKSRGSGISAARAEVEISPKTKLRYAAKCRMHVSSVCESSPGENSQKGNCELDYYEQLSRRLSLTPSQLARAYELQLLAEAQQDKQTTESPLGGAEHERDGVVDLDQWMKLQRAALRQYANRGNSGRSEFGQMSTVLGRAIFGEPPISRIGPLLEALELPWMESVALVDQIFGENHGNEDVDMSPKAIVYRLGSPVVTSMILEDEHLALFFPYLQTWQVWAFYPQT